MFSLVDEPLLRLSPAAGGSARETPLREALIDADAFGDLIVDLPTQTPALLRQLLLPIVVDALGRPATPREWVEWFKAGRWSSEQAGRLNAYLDRHHRLFDLFDTTHPFGQAPDLETAKGEHKGSGLLVATTATGHNVPLFAARTDADPPVLTPAQAVHWMLHTQCWDTAAIKTGAVGDPKVKAGKTTGNPTSPLGQLGVTLLVGRTLYETLLLNIPIGPPLRSDDLPQWRRRVLDQQPDDAPSTASPQWRERAPAGLLDLWTWQARRIRLFPQETDEGPRITHVLVTAGDRMPYTPDFEPHTMWRLEAKPKRGTSPRRPLRLQPGKAAWRGLDALLATERMDSEARGERAGFATSVLLDQARGIREEIGEDYPLRVELTGIVYGTQFASVEDALYDALPLPLAALGKDTDIQAAVLEVSDQAEQLAMAVNHLSADLRRASGADPIPWDKGQRPGEFVLHALDPLVRRLLAGLRGVGDDREAVERGQLAWEQLAWQRSWVVADQQLQAVPVSAYAGRALSSADAKQERNYRVSTAEASFRKRRAEILHRAADARARNGGADDTDSTNPPGDDDV